jgi:hypothetical protein
LKTGRDFYKLKEAGRCQLKKKLSALSGQLKKKLSAFSCQLSALSGQLKEAISY